MSSTVSERFTLINYSSNDAVLAQERMQDVRNELLSWASKIEENIAEADRLCNDGVEMLTPEQFHALKEHRNRLETTYNQLLRHTDSVLQRLSELTKLLLEFSNESSALHSFVNEKTRQLSILRAESGDPNEINESRHKAKALTDEISSNETRLKSISSLATRIQSEYDGYVVELRIQYPDAQIPATEPQELNSTLTRLQTDYELLLRGCQDLVAFLNRLNSLAASHSQNVDALSQCISELERQISSAEKTVISSDVSADSSTMSDMLIHMEELEQVCLNQSSRIDCALRSAAELNSALIGTDAHQRIVLENQQQLDDFQRRQSRNKNRIEENIDSWRSKIAMHEGIRKGMSDILDWLNEKKQLASPCPLPLSTEKLSEMRRENEFLLRELQSRQKLLTELGSEISRTAAGNPTSAARRTLLEQYECAEKDFAPLVAATQTRQEAINDLNGAMMRFSDAEKVFNEKLMAVGEQLTYLTSNDVDSLNEIREQLTAIQNDDWKIIEKEHDYIMISKMEQALNKMSTRVDELISQSEALNTQRKTFNESYAEIVTWLEAIESNAQDLNTLSLNPVELANQRNACSMLQSEHQEHRPQLEHLEDLGSKLVEIETLVRMKSRSGVNTKSEETQSTIRELNVIRQRYDTVGSLLKSRSEKIISISEKLADWDLSRDALSRWVINETKRLETECPVALSHEDISSNISKADRVEKLYHKEKQPQMMEVRGKARHLLNDMSIPGAEEVQNAQTALEKEWQTLADTINTAKERTESSKKLIQGCEDLDKWLKQKERLTSVIGTINIDPKVINNQLIQIELLDSEMDDQNGNRTKINELAHDLITNSSSQSNSQEIVAMMDALNLRWIAFQEGLESKKGNLLKAKESSMQFSNFQRDIRNALLGIAEEVEEVSRNPLRNDTEFEERFTKLDSLQTRALEANTKVDDLKRLAENICEVVDDPALQSDIREQLNITSQSTRELNRKIESLKSAAMSAKAEEGQTVKETENLLKWMKDMKGQLSDIGSISADPRALSEQSKQIDEIYRNVLDKEGDIALLRAKLGEQLRKTPNAQVKLNMDMLNAEWNPLLNDVKAKRANVERINDLVEQLNASLESFETRTEQNKNTLEKLSNDNEDDPLAAREIEKRVERQHGELNALESLLNKLQDISSGPSINQLKRRVENAFGDWDQLSKDVRNTANKSQHKKDVRSRFNKYKEDAMMLLNTTKDSCSMANIDSTTAITGSVVLMTKEDLSKALSELENNWQRQHRELTSTMKELQSIVDEDEAETLEQMMREFDLEYNQIKNGIHSQLDELKEKDEIVSNMCGKIDTLNNDICRISQVELAPIGCELSDLGLQKEHCNQTLSDLNEKEEEAERLANEWKELCESDSAFSNINGSGAVVQRLADLNEQLNKARIAVTQRKRTISSTEQAVNDVHKEMRATYGDLDEIIADQTLLEPVRSELDELRAQQERMRVFREKLRPVGQRVEQAIANCENLIRNADKGINTASLESERKKLIDVWSEIKDRIVDREKQLCSSMQELGSYSDAHNALIVWLQDTEESLANQRPPSIEHKVVKEQTRANDILLKHIDEKQQSVDNFKGMIDKVSTLANDDDHRLALKRTSDNVSQRYHSLVENAYARRARLHEALVLAEQWSQSAIPLRIWLDTTERSLQQLGKIPTDKEKLQQQINAHQVLQEDINAKKWEFDQLVELCPRLAELTSVEEAAELDSALHSLTSKYDNIVSRANDCGTSLQQMDEEIGSFLEHINELSEWLDHIEKDIYELNDISIYPEELIDQSSLLTELAMGVTQQEALVSTVVEDGRELCRQTTGDEAIALQSRIEALRTRYSQVASVTDSKIATLSEALPLSERFHEGCENVQQWMDAVEQDLQNIDQVPLEAQSALIAQMEDDLGKWRVDVDEINSISKQLQELRNGQRANDLDEQTDDLNLRFNLLDEKLTRKAEKLTSAERQTRQVLDELDYLNEWFTDANERLMKASAPAVDPDYVMKQLKNQKQMNEDIAVMKSRLRDAVTDAQKVTRALGDEANGQDALLAAKIQPCRKLSTAVAQMGEDRLGELEQALALCQEVDQSFGELHSWLEKMEYERDNCPSISIGNQRDQLIKQQAHNAELQHSIQAQRPLMDRFIRNVNALRELCDSEDSAQLEKIVESIEDRFEAIREAIKQRADALETALEHSSQFTDRLDIILANLDGAAAQVRHPDPVPAEPDRIKMQLGDIMALKEELKSKEGLLKSVKEYAQEILQEANPEDHATEDIKAKLEVLDALWKELNEGASAMELRLGDTLKKAERFWAELENCQKALEELRARIDDIQPAIGQLELIEEQKTQLRAFNADLTATEPLMSELRDAGRELCQIVADEGKAHVEQQIGMVEDSFATITEIFARKNVDLIDSMEKAMNFHNLFSELERWLGETENTVYALAPISSDSPETIQKELGSLEELRSTLDEKAIRKEELNQMCSNLCIGIDSNQSSALRAPISDLNSRWNRLYAFLNERQQRMERTLLEMGQFSQTYDQLMGWIEKTERVLNEINTRPTNVKEVEIEVCKHKVIQNDVLMHEASIDAVRAAAKRIISIDPQSTAATQPKIDDLNARWHILVDKLEDVWDQLTEAREATENLGAEMDKWALWLQDKEFDLSSKRPCGGLPETAHAQLDDFLVFKNRPELEAHLEASDKYLSENVGNKDTWVAQRAAQLKKKWSQVQEKMVDKEHMLRIALADAEQLHSAMNEMTDWLKNADRKLNTLEPISRMPDVLEKQVTAHAEFISEVALHRELMNEMNNVGTRLQYQCEKKDAIPIKNFLVTAKHRFDKIASRSSDRRKQLDDIFQLARSFFDMHAQLSDWIESSKKWLEEQSVQTTFSERMRDDLDHHKDFQREFAGRQPMFDTTYRRGKSLIEHASKNEAATITKLNERLREQWTELCHLSVEKQRKIEDALLACGQFDEALSSLREWLEKELPSLEESENEPVHGDLDTVNQLIEKHQLLLNGIESQRASLESVRQHADQMLNGNENENETVSGLREKLDSLNADWEKLESLAKKRDERLKEALSDAESFTRDAHNLLEKLPRIEARLRTKGKSEEIKKEVLEQMDNVVQLRKELDDEEPRLKSILEAGELIHAKCVPHAKQPVRCWLKILQTRWDEISQAIDSKHDELQKQLTGLYEQDKLIDEMMKFVSSKSAVLKQYNEEELPDDLGLIESLINDHEKFESTLRERQTDIDIASKGRRKACSGDENVASNASMKKRMLTIRHVKADQLSESWKRLWVDSMDYGQKLQAKKAYLDELKRLESFTFNDWRERYLEWTASGKARISDLFRRIDKSGTGRVRRSSFIDGIMSSKFPTTYLEMMKVADEFDKGDGMIVAKEFLARLRSDYAKKNVFKQQTEGEKINEEVIRQSKKCSCSNPYKIQKVSEGHYRFGDTQIKRMVRILRTTVMVRVGGGWDPLDIFLHNHDPCRAKGRTNIEMQRGFYNDVRPIGAYDTMKTFVKSSRSTAANRDSATASVESLLGGSSRLTSTPGPITKIREKTERSLPMHIPTAKRSVGNGGFLRDTAYEDNLRRDSKAVRPSQSSKPSNNGDISDLSRPGSRCSEASDSSERPTRIPSLRGKKGVGYRGSRASPNMFQ
ncbi:unnamed protein product [Anisakis simplex]|uniref:GAR domain-containing protein n=1 Tax=Anisakis simplex TaxID=6269 RepID=A0A0M3JR11_ANISI|nr:unnamed protein product [Anisakis simplex]